MYRVDPSPEVLRYARAVHTFFFWLSASTFIDNNLLPRAKYAVVFHIECGRPFHAASLSYAILQFTELADRMGRRNEYNRFDLVALCYAFHNEAVVGILFFDDNFRSAYEDGYAQAQGHCGSFVWCETLNCPVSSFPTAPDPSGSKAQDKPQAQQLKISATFCDSLLESVRCAIVVPSFVVYQAH